MAYVSLRLDKLSLILRSLLTIFAHAMLGDIRKQLHIKSSGSATQA